MTTNWANFTQPGKTYRSLIRSWGGRVIIWRGGSAREYRTTLASYRRIRRLLTVSP